MKTLLIVTILVLTGVIAHGQEATPEPQVHIGEVGILRSETADAPVPVCKTKKAYAALMKAVGNNDDEGLVELAEHGLVIPVKQGTKVRKLDITGGLFSPGAPDEIRILEGEYRGQKGYVFSDYIKPAK
jgi:hypothetical protein